MFEVDLTLDDVVGRWPFAPRELMRRMGYGEEMAQRASYRLSWHNKRVKGSAAAAARDVIKVTWQLCARVDNRIAILSRGDGFSHDEGFPEEITRESKDRRERIAKAAQRRRFLGFEERLADLRDILRGIEKIPNLKGVLDFRHYDELTRVVGKINR